MKQNFTLHGLKSFIARYIICLLLTASLFTNTSNAQAPTITKNVGLPTGNISGTGVAYGNSIYVSIFSTGDIYTSANGDTWTKVANPGVSTGVPKSINFGAGVFVVVGQGGVIITSANGLNWTASTSNTTEHLYDVQFLQSAFYAVGMNATVCMSADGITWSTITPGTGSVTDIFMNITYGNSLFVIGARDAGSGSAYIYRSATGTSNSWDVQNIAAATINKVQYLKDKFFLFTSGTDIYTSTDASTWTIGSASMVVTLPDASTSPISMPNQVFNGIYDGTKLYFFGYSDYYGRYGSIYSSTDGLNFTLEPKTSYIVCQGSAYINGKYFEYGNEGIVSSVNGTSYKYPTGSYNGLATNGTNYVGVGSISLSGVTFSSADYTTWTDRSPVAQAPLNAVVYTGTKYVAAGDRTVVESTDGITWNSIATPPDFFTAITFGSNRIVAAGYNALTYVPRISYSSNGISWTTANTGNNYYFKVKFVNNNFFALGYSNDTYLGVILQSADGITWNDVTPTLPYPVYYFNDVVYDGSKYHFMGMEFINQGSWIIDFFSVSTPTPSIITSYGNKGTVSVPGVTLGGNFGEGAFGYSNGRFTGAINDINNYDTYVIYSSDAVNWTAMNVNERTTIFSVIPESNKFRLLGTGDGKITVDFGNITLPVHLTDFTASLVNGQSLLKWQTASEQNSSKFTIQHSTDAGEWHDIGTVKTAGQSQSTSYYQFTHTNPSKGYNYYRLVQTDMDSKQQVSTVRQITIGRSMDVRLYPNPAKEWASIELPEQGSSIVSLFHANGQLVFRQTYNTYTIKLSLQQIPRGHYQVLVDQNGKKYTQQLVKE
ncbi:MAG: T9SS type A sorting domain-containing protein [Chitinophagaceae bacterium]